MAKETKRAYIVTLLFEHRTSSVAHKRPTYQRTSNGLLVLHCNIKYSFFCFLNASVNAKHVFLQLSDHFLHCIWFLDTLSSLVRTKSLLCCAKHALNHTKFAHIHSPFILLVDVCWTAAGSSKDFFCVQNHIFWLITITDFWTTTISTSSSCYVIQFNTMQTNATPI